MSKEILKMSHLKLIPMDSLHIDSVYSIEEECFVTPWSKNSIKKEVENPLAYYYVLFFDNEVAGYGGFWTVLDEGNINNIAIRPKFQGQGLSKILMDKLIEEAIILKLRVLNLEVRSSNKVAQNLYKSYDFKMVGLRKNYYQDIIEDAIIMEKVI